MAQFKLPLSVSEIHRKSKLSHVYFMQEIKGKVNRNQNGKIYLRVAVFSAFCKKIRNS